MVEIWVQISFGKPTHNIFFIYKEMYVPKFYVLFKKLKQTKQA